MRPLAARHDGGAAGRQTAAGWSTAAQTTTGADRRVHDRAAGARLVPGAGRARAGVRRGTLGTDRASVKRFALVVVAAALLAPAADAARYAVGVRTIADLPRLRAALPERREPCADSRARRRPGGAAASADLPGATYVERLGSRRLAFVPERPAGRQAVAPQRHPGLRLLGLECARRSRCRRSGSRSSTPASTRPSRLRRQDRRGQELRRRLRLGRREGPRHVRRRADRGGVDNTVGIAGMAPSAELLIAKVVDGSDLIDVEAEAKAIRWAVRARRAGDQPEPRRPSRPARPRPRHVLAARGGMRSPRPTARASWSSPRSGSEHGTPSQPWPYASYPAALPHVLGVSALARDGSVPVFSNRDKIYNDIAAPGAGIISTMPLDADGAVQGVPRAGLLELRARRVPQGRGDLLRCSAGEPPPPRFCSPFRPGPASRAGDRAADRDRARRQRARPAARRAPPRRDALHGLGPTRRHRRAEALLSGVTAAARPVRAERRRRRRRGALWGRTKRIEATLDFWDDQNDVYAIRLRARPARLRQRDEARPAPTRT